MRQAPGTWLPIEVQRGEQRSNSSRASRRHAARDAASALAVLPACCSALAAVVPCAQRHRAPRRRAPGPRRHRGADRSRRHVNSPAAAPGRSRPVVPGDVTLDERFDVQRSSWTDGRAPSPRPRRRAAGVAPGAERREHARIEIEWRGRLETLDATLDHRDVLTHAAPVSAPRGTFLPSAARWHPVFDGRASPTASTSTCPTTSTPSSRARPPGNASRTGDACRPMYSSSPSPAIDLMAGPYRVTQRSFVARRRPKDRAARAAAPGDRRARRGRPRCGRALPAHCTRAGSARTPTRRSASCRARRPPASACRPSPTWASRCCDCRSSATPRSATRCCTTGGATACTRTTRAATGPRGSPPSWPTTPTASRPARRPRARCASPGCATSPRSAAPRTGRSRRSPRARTAPTRSWATTRPRWCS